MNKIVSRFWEIDFMRGIAIISMILFHIAYDLNYYGIFEVEFSGTFWSIFRISIYSLFFMLVGVSLSLSYSKSKDFRKYLIKGLKVFLCGMLITLTTYIFLEEGYIIFGVLHFIGFSIILAYPFLKFNYLNLAFALLIIAIGIYLYGLSFDFQWLLWLGFQPVPFYTLDYFPLFPHFGIILIGIFVGKQLYPNYNRSFKLRDLSNKKVINVFEFLGKNSLLIYLLHQPIIIGVLLLIKVLGFTQI